MERLGASIKGIYRDVLKRRGDRTVHDSGWLSNAIMDRGRVLLAGFLKNDSPSGIRFLAVGQGLENWDVDEAPQPDPTASDLVNRHSPPVPVSRLNLVYLSPSDGVVTEPTNRLQITATLEPGYPEIAPPAVTFPLREFALFGSFGGMDFMINNVRHPVIHKDASATLIRVIRLYF